MHRVKAGNFTRMCGLGIAVLAVVVLTGGCFFDTKTHLCDNGRRCGPGQVCAANQDVCIPIGGCGDGVVSGDEECDDGDIEDGDGCNASCKSEICGNDALDEGEGCDDGNRTAGDGCSPDCLVEDKVCGNRVVDVDVGIYEDCDTGGEDSLGCDADCTFAKCGDGHLNTAAGEDCDSAGEITDTCNGPLCTSPVCGDSFYNPMADEECDTGGDTKACNGNSGTEASCKVPSCGDNHRNPMFPTAAAPMGEQCDTGGDSNTCDGSGRCTTPMCGDGYTNPMFMTDAAPMGEQCDTSGNSPDCDGDCTEPTCGDGYRNPMYATTAAPMGEECDTAGDSQSCDGGGRCTVPECGDGYTNERFKPSDSDRVEECDDGAANSDTTANACRRNCRLPYCGDRVKDNGEQCDGGGCTGTLNCDATCNCV